MPAGQTVDIDRKADTKLRNRLHKLNQRYRLGLSVHNFPTILQQPSYIDAVETELWFPINQRITTWHKDPDRRIQLHAALDSYTDWAKEREQDIQWLKKSRAHPRTLPEPTSHITQLEFVLGLSLHSSPEYSNNHRKRKREEMADRPPLSTRREDEILYPELPEPTRSLDAAPPHVPNFLHATIRKPSKYQGRQLRTKAHADDTVRDSEGDNLIHNSRKRPKNAATDRTSPAGIQPSDSISRASTKDNSVISFKSAPSAQTSNVSATTSRQASFTESFTSARSDIETSVTSFGSNVVDSAKSPTTGPPNTRQFDKETQATKPLPVPSSRASRTRSALRPASQQDEFATTSSLEDVLVDAWDLTSQWTTNTTSNSVSQFSADFERKLLDLEHQHNAGLGSSKYVGSSYVGDSQNSQNTLAMLPPDSSEQTAVGTQGDSERMGSKVLARGRFPLSQMNVPTEMASPVASTHGGASSRATSSESQASVARTNICTGNTMRSAKLSKNKLEQELFHDKKSPFWPAKHVPSTGFEFRALYELTRVALEAKQRPNDVAKRLKNTQTSDYARFWADLVKASQVKPASLQKSPSSVWQAAIQDSVHTTFGGKLKLEDEKKLKLCFELSPLNQEKESYRFGRKFGSDRFFFLELPHIKQDGLAHRFQEWLTSGEHLFLGRSWRIVYVRDAKKKLSASRAKSKSDSNRQAILFAVNGDNFLGQEHATQDIAPGVLAPISDHTLLNWFLNLEENEQQPWLKLFSRIGLGFTKTLPGCEFSPQQIIRCEDAWSCCPAPRSLVRDQKTAPHHVHTGRVMNDGCGRISYAAAQAIRQKLKLSTLPSAFQGRIGAGKGMWLVDSTGEEYNGEKFWIEITDSQHKFEIETLREPHHRTFEVHSQSHSLAPQHLKFSLIPSLLQGFKTRDHELGVDFSQDHHRMFSELLIEDLRRMQIKLDEGISGGHYAMLEWINSFHSLTGERVSSSEIRMTGDFPDSLGEKLLRLNATGHSPESSPIMMQLCLDSARQFYKQQEEKCQIGLPHCTNALMIPDPFGVLEEGEVFLQFSETFGDEETGEALRILRGMDILVARHPAYLPSDIQRVKAVCRTELLSYEDVIIFSTKGERSLADLLSGGDFDGDKAWVCWEPRLVSRFQNTPFREPPPIEEFGIKQDKETTTQALRRGTGALWQKGIEFNMRSSMLGICADWYLAWIYHEPACNDGLRLRVGSLLAYLVDTAKNGYTFGFEEWKSWQKKNGLPLNFDKPAWKVKEATKDDAKADNDMDYLRFWKIAAFRDSTLDRLMKVSAKVQYDGELSFIYHAEKEAAKAEGQLASLLAIIAHIKKEFELLVDGYARATGKPESFAGTPEEPKKIVEGQYRTRMESLRKQFLAIEPPESSNYHLASRWQSEARLMARSGWTEARKQVTSTFGSWSSFKASVLNYTYQKRAKFLYAVAGPELCDIKKQMTTSPANNLSITNRSFTALRPDKKFLQRMQGKLVELDDRDESNDELGSQDEIVLIDDDDA